MQRQSAWMTDKQLLFWIEVTSRYLGDAMEEARERKLLPPLVQVPRCSMLGCEQPAVGTNRSAAEVSAFCAEHDRQVRAELRDDGYDV